VEREFEAEPIHLELADVLELYAAIIGGTVMEAGNQLRDRSGLEGALARPRAYAHYEDADLALQAAVLAHTGSPSARPSSTATSAWRSSPCSPSSNSMALALRLPILALSSGTTAAQLAELIRPRRRPTA
jgi:hypothetical protein